MAHLVDEREHVVELALEVHEDDRMHAKATGGIGAAALAGCLVHVNPSLGQTLAHDLQVVLAQGFECFEYEIARFLVGELHVDVFHDGHVEVIEVQFVDAEYLLAQLDVLVHGGEMLVHARDEVGVDLGGYLVLVEAIVK